MDERIKLLAELLVGAGVEHGFGVTGSGSSLALITELERLGVRYYPASHETSSAIMAGAVCRVTKRLSVSISIRGPGLANMLPGIVHNHFENNPALSISEAFGHAVPSYRMHKRLDHAGLLSSVIKGMISINEIEQGLSSLLHTAGSEVPGPVHLDLGVKDTQGSGPMPSRPYHASAPSQVAEEAFQRMRKAERPILVAGSLALRRGWGRELATLDIPVFTTVAGKGVLGEGLRNSAGVFTGDGKELAPESHLFAEADLIIGMGLRNTEVLSPTSFGKPVILIDEVNGQLSDGFQADLLLTYSDPGVASDILDILKNKRWGLERLDFLRRRVQEALLKAAWLPSICFNILNDLHFSYALVLDSGSFCTIGEHLWKAGPDRLFLGASNGRYMGVAIPSAVGAAIGKPGFPVFCVVGDGGMQAYPSEIKLAVHERLPVCFVLMTDGRYGSVACAQQGKAMSRRAVSVFRPSWWKPVEAMGCEARAVDSEGSFMAAVNAWDRKHPLFIEAGFDPESYANMTKGLR